MKKLFDTDRLKVYESSDGPIVTIRYRHGHIDFLPSGEVIARVGFDEHKFDTKYTDSMKKAVEYIDVRAPRALGASDGLEKYVPGCWLSKASYDEIRTGDSEVCFEVTYIPEEVYNTLFDKYVLYSKINPTRNKVMYVINTDLEKESAFGLYKHDDYHYLVRVHE